MTGGFNFSRLPVEHLFVEYFFGWGHETNHCVLNECAYYGLKGYVRRPQELTHGPWSDFWRKSSLLLVAAHRLVLPETLLKSNNNKFKSKNENKNVKDNEDDDDDCYADPLLVVMVAEAIEYVEPTSYHPVGLSPLSPFRNPHSGPRHKPVKMFFDCFHEMIDRMFPLLHIDELFIVHRAIMFRRPPFDRDTLLDLQRYSPKAYIRPDTIVRLARQQESSSLPVCKTLCPYMENLTPVALAATLDRELDLIFRLLLMYPTVCECEEETLE